jgi:outer membrane protein OmpA-like peptidoglycan-associated protein/tetratricopeptide (TPR) repeat protein
MLKLRKIAVLTVLLCSSSIGSYAQKSGVKKAEQDFNNSSYIDAIKIYERVANKGYVNTSILSKLGDSYYFNGKLADAHKWYDQLFNANYEDKNISNISSEYYFRYAQTLKAIGEQEEGDKVLDMFAQLEQNDVRARLYESNKNNYLEDIKKRADKYSIRKLSFNTKYSDYGATIWRDKLIYTSARATENISSSKRHDWTNESFTSLYAIDVKGWSFGEPVLFSNNLDSKGINEASAVFTKDGKTMYFTKNNSNKDGKGIFNKNSSSLLKIYKATLNDKGEWSDVIPLPFNSDVFSCAHPALTPDDKWLYFVSDRDGTYGSSDLFRVQLLEFGQYGPIENLGTRINTEARETFPFISEDNILYFSTDGHPGLGGLDVFMAEINKDGTFGEIINLGTPINSTYDDFAFYLDNKSTKGFISSNRPGGQGGDDVYFLEELVCTQAFNGRLVDNETSNILINVKLTIFDNNYKELKSTKSDKKGNFSFYELNCNEKYRVRIEAPEYETSEFTFVANGETVKKPSILKVNKKLVPITVKDDLFKKLNLKPIYFDFNKADIKDDAAIELIKVAEVLREVEGMHIVIRSHTDSRGDYNYNLGLSKRRAEATAKWIISQGIAPNRVVFEGLGSSAPIIKCKTPAACTEEQHAQNRRSEFIITEM